LLLTNQIARILCPIFASGIFDLLNCGFPKSLDITSLTNIGSAYTPSIRTEMLVLS
jgi:hypothetical protein